MSVDVTPRQLDQLEVISRWLNCSVVIPIEMILSDENRLPKKWNISKHHIKDPFDQCQKFNRHAWRSVVFHRVHLFEFSFCMAFNKTRTAWNEARRKSFETWKVWRRSTSPMHRCRTIRAVKWRNNWCPPSETEICPKPVINGNGTLARKTARSIITSTCPCIIWINCSSRMARSTESWAFL